MVAAISASRLPSRAKENNRIIVRTAALGQRPPEFTLYTNQKQGAVRFNKLHAASEGRGQSQKPHTPNRRMRHLAKGAHGFTWTFTCCEWMPFAITTNS